MLLDELTHAIATLKLERIETLLVMEFDDNGVLKVIGATNDGTTLEFIWTGTYWI